MRFSSVTPGKFRDNSTWYLILELGHILLNPFCFIVSFHGVYSELLPLTLFAHPFSLG